MRPPSERTTTKTCLGMPADPMRVGLCGKQADARSYQREAATDPGYECRRNRCCAVTALAYGHAPDLAMACDSTVKFLRLFDSLQRRLHRMDDAHEVSVFRFFVCFFLL